MKIKRLSQNTVDSVELLKVMCCDKSNPISSPIFAHITLKEYCALDSDMYCITFDSK